MMVKVPRDTMTYETFTNTHKVFPYSYISCPCGPPNVLEATWTPKEIDDPYSSTCHKICDLIDCRSNVTCEEKVEVLTVLEVLQTVRLLH